MGTTIFCPADREEVHVCTGGRYGDVHVAPTLDIVRPGDTAWGWNFDELRAQGDCVLEFVVPGEAPPSPQNYGRQAGPADPPVVQVTVHDVIERLKRRGLPCAEQGTLRRIRDMLDNWPDIRRHVAAADLAWLETACP